MKVVWLNGWGRSIEETARIASQWLPVEHVVVQPFKDWRSELEGHVTPNVWLCGYSLGAFLLLGAADLTRRVRGAYLFAPFLDIKAESACGGRVPELELNGLGHLLDIKKDEALKRFTFRAGLLPDSSAASIPVEDLKWGLATLLTESRGSEAATSFACWVGARDPLIDSLSLSLRVPHLRVEKTASHCLSSLLSGLHAF